MTTESSVLLHKLTMERPVVPEVSQTPDWDLSQFMTLENLFLFSAGTHTIIAICAPLFAVQKWQRRKSSDSDILSPYLVGGINTLLWARYGFLVDDIKFALLTTFGVLMHIYIIGAHQYYRTKSMHKSRQSRVLMLSLVGVCSLLVYINNLDQTTAVRTLGTVCSVLQSATAFVLFFMILHAYQRKAMDFLQFEVIAFGTLVAAHGVIYSWMRQDIYMGVANTMFLFGNGSLLSLFWVYPTTLPAPRNVSATVYHKPSLRKASWA